MFGSLVFAVSWFLSFSLLDLYLHVFVKRNSHMFSTSVLTSPFLSSEQTISGHLLKSFFSTTTSWFVLRRVFHCCHGSASTYASCGHKMHVAQYIHPVYHIQPFGGSCILPDSPRSVFSFKLIQFLQICNYTTLHVLNKHAYIHSYICIYIILYVITSMYTS